MDRDALVKRFGEEVGNRIPLSAKREGKSGDSEPNRQDTFAKAVIYEVWDSSERETLWICLGMPDVLDEKPYPLKVSQRFPIPTPLFGTMTSDTMVPVPDFVFYQDQAGAIDMLTQRISALTAALKVRGFTPGDMAGEMDAAVQMDGEALLVPIRSWAAMGPNKLGDLVLWLPIDVIARTITELHGLRDKEKADAYEVTGLSDILRGATQASETATAQQLKAQWGSVRVRNRQQDVQRFAAEALRLFAEVMCSTFDAQRLLETAVVAAMPPADQQWVGQAINVLKGEAGLRQYRVSVETDSTVEADAAADKQAVTELLTGVTGFLTAAAPILQGLAASAPSATGPFAAMLGEMLLVAVRRFKAGPSVETSIEAAFEALGQAGQQAQAMAGQPRPVDPVEQAKTQLAQAKVQVEGGKVQVSAAQVQAERERTAAQREEQAHDSAHRSADRQMDAARMQHEAALQRADLAASAASQQGQPMAIPAGQ